MTYQNNGKGQGTNLVSSVSPQSEKLNQTNTIILHNSIAIQINSKISLSQSIDSGMVSSFRNAFKNKKVNKKVQRLLLMTDSELMALEGKDKYILLVSLFNAIRHWETKQVSLEELKSHLEQGDSYRGCVKVGGNSKSDIVSVALLSLDFDNGLIKLEDALKNPFSENVVLAYESSSSRPDCPKFRLVFKLSNSLTVKEYEQLYRYVSKQYSECEPDPDTLDAGRLFFGTNKPVQIINPLGELDVSKLLPLAQEIAPKQKSKTPTNGLNKSVEIIEKQTKHQGQGNFFKKIDEFVFNEIWVKLCNQDINAFFCAFPHDFAENPDNDPLKEISWRGSNFGGDGTGLWCWINDGENLPCVKSSRSSKGGQKYTSYFREAGIFNGELPADITLRGMDFDRVMKYMFSLFGLTFDREQFKDKQGQNDIKFQLKVLGSELYEVFKSEIVTKYIKLETSVTTGNTWVFYNLVTGYWQLTENKDDFIRDTVCKYLMPHFIDYCDNHELTIGDFESFFGKYVYGDIVTYLKFYCGYERTQIRDISGTRNKYAIALKDGDFYPLEGHFVKEFNPENNNQSRYNFNYKKVTECPKELDDWLSNVYDAKTAELIKYWIILNIHGRASETAAMVNFFGTPGTGKSTVLAILSNILRNMSEVVNGTVMFQSDNKFALSAVVGKFALLIDEFQPTKEAWELLKRLSGNAQSLPIQVEHKGCKPYTDIFYGGITTASQNELKLPPTADDGVHRRIIPIKHHAGMKSEANAELAEKLSDPRSPICEEILLWGCHQNSDEILAKFMALVKSSEEIKQAHKDVVSSSDLVGEFLQDAVEFTNNSGDVVPTCNLKEAFRIWLEQDKCEDMEAKYIRSLIAKIPQYMTEKADRLGIDWLQKPDMSKAPSNRFVINHNGATIRGFKGIKVNLAS